MTKEIFIEAFNNGESIKNIAALYNVSYQKVYYAVKHLKKPRFTYKNFTKKEKEDIKNLYLSNHSTVEIGKKYGVTNKVIARILNEFDIKRNGLSKRKYNLNESYFDEITTPNQAYILGFLYADGSNNSSKSTVSISLQEEDKDILERMRLELASEKELDFLDYSKKDDYGYNYKNQYRLLLFSKHICNSLEKLGMVPNKSLVLTFPDTLPPSLYKHFIRGYFDGDGSFSPQYSKDGKFQPVITITSTSQFCHKTQEILKQSLDICGGNIYDASCHNGITKVLSISGSIQVKKILDWLYSDADMYLERKHDRYVNTFYKN